MRETKGRECGILRIVPANVYCLRDVQEMVKKEGTVSYFENYALVARLKFFDHNSSEMDHVSHLQ